MSVNHKIKKSIKVLISIQIKKYKYLPQIFKFFIQKRVEPSFILFLLQLIFYMKNNNQNHYFSFRGVLALVLCLFLTYEIFQVIRIIKLATNTYNENFIFQLFVDYIRISSEKGPDFVDAYYSKIEKYIYILFVSFSIKSLLSFKHAFINDNSNAEYLFYLLLLEVIFFGLFFGFIPISDFLTNAFIIAIPSIIIISLFE
jgi:hypothetical protein